MAITIVLVHPVGRIMSQKRVGEEEEFASFRDSQLIHIQNEDMRSSRLQNVAAGLGSRMLRRDLSSSSDSSIDFCRNTMLLMVLTGELA